MLFQWQDGPLVLAMKNGEPILIDEISLADDSVLERLNSVLEPEKTLLLSEMSAGSANKAGDSDCCLIRAKDGFSLSATMNPGGDYGKREVIIFCPIIICSFYADE